MNLILYNPVSTPSRKPVLPMSLLALGALLEGEYDYRIVDGNLIEDPLAELDGLIAGSARPVLAVTVMPGPQLNHSVPLCRQLKARHPELIVIWGGYFPTQHYDVCLQAPYVDYVVRGHGERVFKALLDGLAAQQVPGDLPGLARRGSASDAVVSAPLAPIPEPQQLPAFPYHRIDPPRYVRPTFMGSRTMAHHSSYGCPFLCNFCAVVNMVNGRWLAQSAEKVAAVVQGMVDTWQVDSVEFYDNNFFTDEARTREIAERIAHLDLGWWGEGRIDTMLKYTDRSWQAMAKSGLRMVYLGAESGSDETLQRMDKGGTASTEKTLLIAERMKRYDIVPEFSFIVGNPPDPEGDTRQTIAFIRRLKRIEPRAEIILYMYTPVPLAGTLFEQAKATGFRFPDSLEGWVSPEWQAFSERRSVTMPWLGDPLRRHLRDFERVLHAYYPTVTDITLRRLPRWILKSASGWRYHLEFYHFPLELRLLQRLMPYQRPETSGF